MSDDLTKRGAADARRVNVEEPWEVRYWTAKFGCTEEELRLAVKMVGTLVADLEAHFGG